jgi:hypothetical protein
MANVISRKQPDLPEVEFPVWLYRADGRSMAANTAKEYGDLQRAGYVSEEAIAPEKPAENPAAKRIARKGKAKSGK